ncbi:WD40-repeat-containing domain protein, partial [Entophlyctis helioformis]
MNLEMLDPFGQAFPDTIFDRLVHEEAATTTTCAYNRRANLVAAGTRDGRCLVWDLDTRSIVLRLKGHVQPITSVSWSRRGRHILTASRDWNCILWDLETARRQLTVKFTSPVLEAHMHPRNRNMFVAIAQGDPPFLVQFDASNDDSGTRRQLVRRIALDLEHPALFESPSGSGAGSGAGPPTETTATTKGTPDILATTIVFSQDGRSIFVGTTKGHIAMFDSDTGLPRSQVKIGATAIKHICFSRSGRDMLVNSHDRIIRWLTVGQDSNGRLSVELQNKYQDAVDRNQWSQCCFSADGEMVVGALASNQKHNVYIWDKAMGSLVKMLEGPREGLIDMVWHPTRPIFATVSHFGSIYFWGATYTQSFSAFAPFFEELDDNIEYQEREDEFDEVRVLGRTSKTDVRPTTLSMAITGRCGGQEEGQGGT